MHGNETAEAAERHLQREDVAHAVNGHDRCQPRVVHMNAQHTMLYNNPPPLSVNGFAIRQESHAGLDCAHFMFSLGYVKPRPLRTTGRVITFQSSAMFWCVSAESYLERRAARVLCPRADAAERIGSACHAEQDVRINDTTESPSSRDPGRATHAKWSWVTAEFYPRTEPASRASCESLLAYAGAERLALESLLVGQECLRRTLRVVGRAPDWAASSSGMLTLISMVKP